MTDIEAIAYAARNGDLAGVNLALDMMILTSGAEGVMRARARADLRSGRERPLPQLGEDALVTIAREGSGYQHRPSAQVHEFRPRKQRRRR